MTLARRATAEFLGTALLLAVVAGSGIMGERLAGGNVAIALLANALATGAGLCALLLMFGPVSGAHFNPLVTVSLALTRRHPRHDVAAYLLAQCAGGIAGIWLAHAMFGLPVLQLGIKPRPGLALMLSEVVASFGLFSVIVACGRHRPGATVAAVPLYVVAAYWFTASTAFANPAVTIARAFTTTFCGIAPADVPGFIIAQCVGFALALLLEHWLHAADTGGENVVDTAETP
jgi:glycerol uptake facilitator-like aquaporin